MKNAIAAGVLALTLGATVGATTVGYIWQLPATDIQVAQHPCATGLKGPVAPFLMEGVPKFLYTCNDDTVIVRDFAPVVIQPPIVCTTAQVQAGTCGFPRPFHPTQPPNACAHIPGFVEGVNGGCVPADHPLARPKGTL